MFRRREGSSTLSLLHPLGEASDQVSKATPKNSSCRQISRHVRPVRKPSKKQLEIERHDLQVFGAKACAEIGDIANCAGMNTGFLAER